jgi:hypothetical protein
VLSGSPNKAFGHLKTGAAIWVDRAAKSAAHAETVANLSQLASWPAGTQLDIVYGVVYPGPMSERIGFEKEKKTKESVVGMPNARSHIKRKGEYEIMSSRRDRPSTSHKISKFLRVTWSRRSAKIFEAVEDSKTP